MAEQHQEFLDAGAQVLAVVHTTPEEARAYVERHALPFPLLVDANHEVFERYGVESAALSLRQRPGLFLIDLDGVVRFAHVGRQQWEIPSNALVLEQVRCMPCAVRE